MVNRIIERSKGVLRRSLAMSLAATMACTFLPEAASAEELEEDSAIEMKFRDAPEDATDTDSDEVKAEKEYQKKNSQGQYYTCDTAEGKVVLDGDKLGESGKDLKLKLYISKEYVIEDSIEIYGSRKNGTDYTIDFSSDDEYYIAELNQSDIDTFSDFIMTYSFKVKEGMIPSDQTIPVHATFEYDGQKSTSSDISFSPIYEAHTVKEMVGSDNNKDVANVTESDGSYIVGKDETIPFAVSIDKNLDTSKLRKTKEITVKQKLPTYENVNGEKITASLAKEGNEGWSLTSDKAYVEKTYQADSYDALVDKINSDKVNLSFEGLVLKLGEDFQTYSTSIKAEASIEGVPDGQSEAEANFKANDEAMFTVTFKGSGTTDQESAEKETTENQSEGQEDADKEADEKETESTDDSQKKEDAQTDTSKLEKAQEKVESLKEDNKKTLLVKYLFVAKNKLSSSDTIDTVMEGADRSKIFTSFTVDTQLYKDSDGKYKAVANIPYLNDTAEGEVLDYQFANGNNDGEPVTQGVSFNKKTMVVTMDESSLQADSDDFANLQLEVMIPVTQSTTSTMSVHVDNNSNIELAQGTDFSQTSGMFSVPRIQIATKETATKIKSSDISVQVNGASVDSDMVNYDASTGEVVLTGYPAMIDNVNITVNKSSSKTASQGDRATGGSSPADTVAWLPDGTDANAFQVGASVDTSVVIGHTAFATTVPYQSPVGDNYVGAVNGSQMMTGSSIGIPTNLFGVNFQWYNSNGSSMGTYTGTSNYNRGIPSYCQHIYDSAHFERYLPATVRVLSKDTSNGITYVTFAVQTNVAFSGTATAGVGQTLGCTFRVAFKSNGKVKVKKTRDGGDDTSIYKLAGAQYGVYQDADCATSPLAVLTTDSNGNTGEAALEKAGTYYVKEISSPKTFALDPTIHEVKVTLGQTATVKCSDKAKPVVEIKKESDTPSLTNAATIYKDLSGFEYTIYSDEACTKKVGVVTGSESYLALDKTGTYYAKETKAPKNYELDETVHKMEVTNEKQKNTFTFTDKPIYSTVDILINKVDERNGQSLEGAEFEVYYYDAVYSDGYNPLQAGISASKYWRLKSDSKGQVKLDKDHFVAGDDFYVDGDGKAVLPLGTVVIREVEAPTNYEINEGNKIVTIKDSSKTKPVTVEDTPKIKIVTMSKGSGQDENSKGNSAYSLEGAEYDLYSDAGCTKLIDSFTTDKDGVIFKDYDLYVGTYYLKETKAPKGYALNTEVFEFKVTKDQSFEVTDNPKFNPLDLLLTKKDKDSGEALQGAYFEVSYYKGQYASTDEIGEDVTPDAQWIFETDKNGQVKMDEDHLVSGSDFYKDSEGNIGVPIGTITIQETKAPSNYQLDETVHVYQIKDDTSVKTEKLDNYKAKTYTNEKIPGQVTLTKKSSNPSITRKNSMYSLEGAKYLISTDKEGKNEVATLTTNEYGETEALTDLKEGTYYAREIEAPKGYKLNSEVKKVVLKSGDSASFEFEDEPYYSSLDVFLKKKNSVTEKYLQGAVYLVTFYGSEDTNGKILCQWELETDKNGQIKLDKDHLIEGSLTEDVPFFTDEDGNVVLPLGTVTFQEIEAPKGYKIDNKVYTIPISEEAAKSAIQFNVPEQKNEPKPAELKLKKVSKFSFLTDNNNSYSLEGTELTIYKDERCTEEVLTLVTDAEGVASTNSKELQEGTYYIKETKAPKGFKLDSIPKKVELQYGQETEVEIEDLPEIYEAKGNFKFIHKVDSDSREALENVQYTAKFYEGEYAEGVDPGAEGVLPTKTWVLKTDTNGDAILDADHLVSGDGLYTDENGDVYLPLGTVTVQETQTASNDYVLDDTVHVFTLQPDANGNVSKISTITASNKHRTGKFFISKISDKPELTGSVSGFSVEGAVYGVYTDKDCKNLIKKLTVDKFGNTPTYEVDVTKTYYIKEITPPDKYDLDETVYEVKTNPEEETLVVSTDDVQMGKAKIKKTSADSDFVKGNSNYTLAGAQFGIYRDKACILLVDTLTTDEDGNTPTADLEVGTYYVKEVSAPAGYHTDETLHKFTVAKDETATIEVSDTPLYGQLTLEKESADKATTEGTDYYSLKGAVYGVYSDKVCTKKVDTLTTDENGKTDTLKLQLGTYYVKEITAPLGYLIDDTVYEVEATSDPNTEEPVLVTLHVSDEVRKMDISIIKDSADHTVTDENDNYSLEGAVFGVYSDSNCKNLVGQLTANKKVDGKWKTDSLAVKIGTYYVKEITAPKGYELNKTVYAVDVKGNGDYNSDTTTFTSEYKDGSKIERVNGKDSIQSTLTIKDDYQKAKVKVLKTSANSSVTANNSLYSLEGAVYGIYSDKAATKEVDRLTTNANGVSNIVELPLGIYYIKEITAPKGFELDTQVHEVNATKGDETVKVELSDAPDHGKVQIKKSSTNAQVTANNDSYSLAGAEFSVYSDEKCTKWVTTLTTNEDGSSESADIPIGTYYVKEITAPEGFTINTEVKKVVVEKGQSQVVKFEDSPKMGSALVMKTSSLDQVTSQNLLVYSLAGAEYSIYTDQAHTNLVAKVTTKDDGSSDKVELPIGTYYVIETKASKGFTLDTEEKVIEVKEGLTATFNSVETPQGGIGQLKKSSSNPDLTSNSALYSLAGATYGIYLTDECIESDKVGEFVTDEDGNSETVQLPVGVYFVKEIEAPKGFAMDTKVHTMAIEQDKTAVLEVVDQPGTAKVRLNKKSANTDITNYNNMYDFSGAVYTVYSDEACTQKVTTLTTDKNGNTETKEISMGTYYIKETSAPESFTLDTEVHKVELNDTETTVYVEVSEVPDFMPIDLVLQKVDKSTGLASKLLEGAEFTFRFYGAKYDEVPTDNKNLIRTWTLKTDANGQIKFDADHFVSGDAFFTDSKGNVGLPYGTIVVQETKSPDGYLGDTNEYVIQNNKTKKYSAPTIKEEPIRFTLEKKHKGTAILIPNAVFRHTNPDGTYEDIKTGADGKLTISNAQPGTHFLQEIEAPAGYKINPTVLKVVVSKTGDYYNYGERKSTVSFDANGGSAVSTTINKNSGDELGSLPTTSLAHYTFEGWYTEKVGGTKIEETDLMPADDTTYYAHWAIQTSTQQILARYQNPDGSYGSYQTVYNRSHEYGSTVSWSQAETNEFEAVSIKSYTATTDKVTHVDVPRKQTTLTVGIDSLVDASGNSTGNATYDTTDGFGVYTLTINGKTVGTDITSYTSPILVGSTYEISNVKSSTAKTSFVKAVSGSLSGTITAKTRVGLQFTTSQTTVTYNTNGGTVSGKGSSWSVAGYYGQKLGELATPARDGYTFQGWYTEQNGGTKISSATMYPLTDTTYYAVWTANTYHITYDANSGTGAPAKQAFSFNSGATISSTKPTRTGYTFTGWKLNNDILQPGSAVPTNSKDITLTAQWSLDTYMIAYDTQGGTASGLRTSYNVNSDSYTLPTPVREGYTFAGWSGSNGSTPQMSVSIAKGSTGTKSYTANWKANTYTVSYNANGGEIQSGASSESKTFGNVLGNFPSVSRKGYTLTGWYTKASGGSQVTEQSPVPSANTTYYAQWSPVTYSITYDNVDSTDNLKTSYNIETDTFTLGTPTKEGYTFTGWTGSNGNIPQTSVSVSKGSTGNLAYRANWSINKYVIDVNGYLDGSTSETCDGYGTFDVYINDVLTAKGVSDFGGYYEYGTKIELKNIQGTTGHEYAGTTKIDSGYNYISGVSGTLGTNGIWIGLVFNSKTYTLTYDGNNGGTSFTSSVKYGNSVFILPNSFTKDHYKFAGWNTRADGKGEDYTSYSGKSMTWKIAEDVTLYAQWTPEDYSISYNLNGGSISGNPTSYNVESNTFTLPTPTKEGYTFAGWTGSNGSTPQTSVTINQGSYGDLTYTANWTPNKYAVDINGYLDGSLQGNTNGYGTFDVYVNDVLAASGVSDFGNNYDYGTKIEIKNVKAADGREYAGIKDGLGSPYISGTSGTVGTSGLYMALAFNTKSYTLSYDGNGSDGGSVSSQTIKYGDGFKTASNGFTKTNYTFTGWNTRADGSGADFTQYIGKTQTWAWAGDLILYAQWKTTEYILTYNPNGGEVSPKTASVAVGAQIGSMPTPTKAGYNFAGWYTSASGGTQVTSTSTLSSNTTVFAHWAPISYTVAYDANEGSGTTASSTHTYGQSGTLTKNGFYRNGYTFAGWATSASGSVVYEDEDSVSNLATKEGETVTLYAKWTPKTIVVTYNANGGTGTTSNKATYGESYTVLSGSAVSRSGYTFKGWSTHPSKLDGYGWTNWSGTWSWDNGQNGIIDGAVTLYAIWVKTEANLTVANDPGWIDVFNNGYYTVRCYLRYFLDADARQIRIRVTTMQIQSNATYTYSYSSQCNSNIGYRLVYYNGSSWTDSFCNRESNHVAVGAASGGPTAYTFPDANCDLTLTYNDDGTLPTAVKLSTKCLVDQLGAGAAYVPHYDFVSYDSAIDITSKFPTISSIKTTVNGRSELDLLARGNADAIEDGTYAICFGADENYCIGVKDASTSNEVLVELQEYTGANSQLWRVTHDSNGYVTFTNVNSGYQMNDKNGNTDNEAKIQQYNTQTDTDYASKWIVSKEASGYRIVTARANTHDLLRAVDVYGGVASSGGAVGLYDDNSTQAQRWVFKKVS